MTTRPAASCRPQRNQRVGPEPSSCEPLNIIQIRKGRWLHIQHIIPEVILKKHSVALHQPIAPSELHVLDEKTADEAQRNDDSIQNLDGDANGAACKPSNMNPSITSLSQDNPPQKQRLSLHDQVLEKQLRNSDDSLINNRMIDWPTANSELSSLGSLRSVMEDGDTVFFFIHGVGGSSDLWQYQMRYFVDEGFEVVAADLLGHGLSRAPHQSQAYTFQEHADDMLAVFDRFCKKRNVLVGHSYGACFCAKIASERSRKVTKIVLISGGGPVSLQPELCQLFCLPSPVLTCIKPVIINGFVSQAFHKNSQHTKQDKTRTFDVPAYVLRATMQGQLWMEGNEDYHAALNVGVLLIYGMQDELVQLDDEKWMNETIYASQLETLDNASHMVMIEQPEKVNSLIHDFVLKDTMVRRRHAGSQPRATLSAKAGQHGKTMPHVTIT
ncbi:protein ABHD8-like [Asterias amurensis]|uniref:protein ABHD8-like n=1 Tax=Asterias amurensis TaxID=7602 RepID=UPI003AB12184